MTAVIGRHVLELTHRDLSDIIVGEPLQLVSDQGMPVFLSRDLPGAPKPAGDVVLCVVTNQMIADLRQQGHTSAAPQHSPYLFGLTMTPY